MERGEKATGPSPKEPNNRYERALVETPFIVQMVLTRLPVLVQRKFKHHRPPMKQTRAHHAQPSPTNQSVLARLLNLLQQTLHKALPSPQTAHLPQKKSVLRTLDPTHTRWRYPKITLKTKLQASTSSKAGCTKLATRWSTCQKDWLSWTGRFKTGTLINMAVVRLQARSEVVFAPFYAERLSIWKEESRFYFS